MGKGEELTTTKYLIHAQINANGIVEKPDVVRFKRTSKDW